jgi:spore coat polysaccharide biosynthesis protein SpsF
MGSERLPGKVLLDIEGQTMLERVVRRVQRARRIDRVVVATTTEGTDDAVVSAASALGVDVTRGSENDVLDRFRQAAIDSGAGSIVRICADSPFVDPEVCDLVVRSFLDADPPVDYASNKLDPSFPLGLDVEAFSRHALERAAREAHEPFERSHVTMYMYQNPDRFRLLPVIAGRDLHSWRWTVDTPADLAFARAVFQRLYGVNDFSWRDVVALIEREPELAELNSQRPPQGDFERLIRRDGLYSALDGPGGT